MIYIYIYTYLDLPVWVPNGSVFSGGKINHLLGFKGPRHPGWKVLVYFMKVEVNQGTMGCTPNSVPMVFIVFNLGILGDNLPINTHYIGLI